ncbi:MAG TPA: helix-turn-helix domain-containing protein [Solirubrobacteraceae bacterium]|nr:helix-turn-helix domain-containing protein [Solirubrobacteraceae bacterium]
MDRDSLKLWLSAGLSLEQIGKRVGRHPSTIGYWVQKHGLEAVNREKHAARGGLRRHQLEPLVEGHASVAEIAQSLGVSKGTVRHWLRRYGLRTSPRRGRPGRAEAATAKRAGQAVILMECRHHGKTEFWLEGRGYYRCMRCRWEAVVRHRRKLKKTLVSEAGGRCQLCGYDRYAGALHFHHLDPATKEFSLSHEGITLSLDRSRGEAQKCILLCANCHAEVEGRVATITSSHHWA